MPNRLVDFLDLDCYNNDLTAGMVEKVGLDVKPLRQESANVDQSSHKRDVPERSAGPGDC